MALIVSAPKKFLKVELVFIYIKSNTVCKYSSNEKTEIPTIQEIILFRLRLCGIIFFFGATYMIALFINLLFCVSKICRYYFRNLSILNRKESSLGGCRDSCNFICNGIFHPCHCNPFYLWTLLSWSTNVSCNVNDCRNVFQ